MENEEEEEEEVHGSPSDPRVGEWKIAKNKGFSKDRENKAKKMSKTAKCNSREPLFDVIEVMDSQPV